MATKSRAKRDRSFEIDATGQPGHSGLIARPDHPADGDSFPVQTPWGKLDVAAGWRQQQRAARDAGELIARNRQLVAALEAYAYGETTGPACAQQVLVALGYHLPETSQPARELEVDEIEKTGAELAQEAAALREKPAFSYWRKK